MMNAASSGDLHQEARLLAAAPEQVSQADWQLFYEHIIDIIARDIDDLTSADGRPARDPKRAAKALVAMVAGWFRMQLFAEAVTVGDAVAFGERAVELFLAGRSAW